jgi:hypothetical protein
LILKSLEEDFIEPNEEGFIERSNGDSDNPMAAEVAPVLPVEATSAPLMLPLSELSAPPFDSFIRLLPLAKLAAIMAAAAAAAAAAAVAVTLFDDEEAKFVLDDFDEFDELGLSC